MRVIQDSDDDFEDDLESEAQATGDASAVQQEQAEDATSTSGTGSTGMLSAQPVIRWELTCVLESLKRAFAEAHRNHLQSPSTHYDLPSQEEPHSSVSLPEHVSKKMKTLHDASPHKSPSRSSLTKVPVTYGKERESVDSSPFLHLVNDEIEVDNPEPYSYAALGLEGTMREGYIQHDPMILFPEPSSTIPNATLTQQRVLEGVVAPAFLGVESEADLPAPLLAPDASVPWSEILKFSPVGTGEQFGSFDLQAEDEQGPAHIHQVSDQTQNSSKSQGSRRGSSVRLQGSPLSNEVLRENIDPKEIMQPPQPILPSQDVELPSTGPGVSQAEARNKSQKSSQHQKSKVSSVSNCEEDVAAIGLPAEQYKPRPSRSRSLKVSQDEPVDYSIRPEKASKGTKRRKTTTAEATRSTVAVDSITTPHKVMLICEMGFTPKSTGRALKQNNGDVTRTVEWLVNNGMGEDELASSNTPKRKPASKAVIVNAPVTAESTSQLQPATVSKTVNIDTLDVANVPPDDPPPTKATDGPSETMSKPETDQLKSPNIQVVIPMKSPKPKSTPKPDPSITSSKKAKRRKTTSDMPEPVSTLEIPALPEATTEKRRGRGRPKKMPKALAPIEPVHDVPQEAHLSQNNEADAVLQTIEPNATTPATSISSGIHASEDTQNQPLASGDTPKNPGPPEPARTPEQSAKPISRSPTSKGKATYRVGLSKRARIAPLLRVLKK